MVASQQQAQIPIVIKTDFEISLSIYMWSGSFLPCELSDSFMEMGSLPKLLKSGVLLTTGNHFLLPSDALQFIKG